jgi:hypothetical protein
VLAKIVMNNRWEQGRAVIEWRLKGATESLLAQGEYFVTTSY